MSRIELSHGPIHYTDSCNSGPAVVFVHGALVDGSLWANAAQALASSHRCIVPTWPLGSHTEPMHEDADLTPRGVAALVAEFFERLDLDDVTLVGNDTGGAICQLVAAHHPQRLGRLVLTNCDAFEVFPPRAFRYLTLLPRVPGLMTVVSKELHALPVLARSPTAFGRLSSSPIDSATLRRWLRPGAKDRRIRRDTAKLLRGVRPEITLDAAKLLPAFDRPVLLLWGERDPFFTLSLAERLQRLFPRAVLETVPEARTFVSLDAPQRLADAIARFTRTGQPREARRQLATAS